MASLNTQKTSSTNKSIIGLLAHEIIEHDKTKMVIGGLMAFFLPRIIMATGPWIAASAGWLYTSIVMPMANLSGFTPLLKTVGPFLYNSASTLIVYISSLLSSTPVLICLTIAFVAALFAAGRSTIHINLPSDSESIARQKRIERKLCELQLSAGNQVKRSQTLYPPTVGTTSTQASTMTNDTSTTSSQTESATSVQPKDRSSTSTGNPDGSSGDVDNPEQNESSAEISTASIDTSEETTNKSITEVHL